MKKKCKGKDEEAEWLPFVEYRARPSQNSQREKPKEKKRQCKSLLGIPECKKKREGQKKRAIQKLLNMEILTNNLRRQAFEHKNGRLGRQPPPSTLCPLPQLWRNNKGHMSSRLPVHSRTIDPHPAKHHAPLIGLQIHTQKY